ncbi:PAS domain S-box protein [Sulfurospirillum oryzae]|uniref:PAS domain S-box protein n=1 Tax=Sulfurospirillum oryzae TaxID=2976535 RepID=UPI0021E6E441|nr:PAS domain S-box protein [Sulfurospirillum oryzae]
MNRFKYVLNHTKVGMAVWSTKDNRFKFMNTAFAHIHGYESDELLGADVRHLFAPESMQRLIECENNPACFHAGDMFFEAIHLKKTGIEVPLNIHITIVKDDSNIVKHFIAHIIDISNHKKTDTKLAIMTNVQESELLRSIAQNIPGFAFIYKLHPDGKEEFVYASDKILDTYGIDAPTVLSDIRTLRNLFYSDDMPHFRAAINESAKTLQPFHAEFRINHPQKGIRWLESNSIPTAQTDGSILWHGITMDITSRKNAEQALSKTATHLSSLVNTLPDLVWMKNTEGTYLTCNHAFERFFGASECEIVGKTDYDFIDYKLADFFRQKDKEAIEKGNICTNEEVITYKDTGTTGILETRKVPIFNPEGEVYGVLGIAKDITEQKKAKLELQHQSNLLNSILNSSPNVIIFALDTEYRYLTFNQNHKKTMKALWNENVSIGMNILESITRQDDRHKAKKLFDKALAGEYFVDETSYGEDHFVRSYWQTFYSPMYNHNGTITGLTCFNLDITEQKKAKENLLLKEFALDKINEAVYLIDKDAMFHYVNERACRDLGYSKEELLTMGVVHIDPNISIELWHELWQGIKEFRSMTSKHKRKDGTLFPMEVSSSYFEYNGIPYTLAIVRDITERKAQEEAIAQREREFRTLTENSPDTIARFDQECRRTYVNPAFERVLGLSSKDVLGKKPSETTPVENAFAFEKQLQEVLRSGKEFTTETPYTDCTGKHGTGHIRMLPEFGKDNQIVSVICIGRDITERKRMEEELAKKEEAFRTITEHTPDTVVRFNRECKRTYVNPSTIRMTGLLEEELLGAKPSDFSPLKDSLLFEKTLIKVIETGEEATLEMEFVSPLGEKGWRHLHIVPEIDINGEISSVLAIGRDISEHKKIELQLRDSEIIFQEAQRIAKIGSWKLDIATQAITWSEEMYRIFEIDPQSTKSRRKLFMEIIHPEDLSYVKEIHYQAQKKYMPYETTHRILLKNGTLKYIHAKAITYYDDNQNAVSIMGTVQDVTEQKMVEKQVEFLAHHDALTELPNRMLAQSRCEQSIAYAKRNSSKVALLFIDIDGFKTINDSLGHAFGDMMLKMVASRLKKYIRQTDTLSRQGGDEFLMMLTDVEDVDDVSTVAQKLLREFEKPFQLDTHSISSSISIGIALYPDDGKHFDALLQRADTAMYKAKEAGRNTYCFFTEAMNKEIFEHLHIQNDLKQALVQQQFVLHYQPQIDLETNTISGVEALLRWNHPKNGLVPPMKFIPIAESSGQILEIGEWVIYEACHQASKWHQQGINITMAVNISAIQFKRGNLEQVIQKALESSGLNPQYLELELTESILIHDTENVLHAIRRLKILGIKLSIDDFGTGYSSLSYLKRFAVDKLKIDQSFVKDISKDQEDAIIVKTIIQMAKSLNLKTIAEGVETKEVLEIIKSHDCDEVQGFYFAKPMCAEDFIHYFSQKEFTA